MSRRTKAKTKTKYDLRSSILLLLLITILLFSSTYAWFTANQTVTISSLDVHIEAQNGLQISTDATTWKTLIDNIDITEKAYAGNTNKVPANAVPVSTVGEIDSQTGNMKMFYGTVEADENDGIYKLTADQAADAEGKYIVFDMFLKVDKDTNLRMTEASDVVMKENSTDKGIKQAARVAFCLQGVKESGAALSEITSLKGAVSHGDPASTVYIWEPNYNLHTAAAVAHARDAYNITTTADGSATALDWYGINKDITTPLTLNQTMGATATADFSQVTPDYKTLGENAVSTDVFSLKAGITKVRVYMWVEGQDVDCENAASGTDISYNVQLEVAE